LRRDDAPPSCLPRTPAGHPRRTGASNRRRPETCQPVRVTVGPIRHYRRLAHHVMDRHGWAAAVIYRRPGAFEQIALVLPARGSLGDQRRPAVTEMPQPRPGRISAFRGVTAQLDHQPRNQHNVLIVVIIAGVVLRLPGSTPIVAAHTPTPYSLGSKLIRRAPASDGR